MTSIQKTFFRTFFFKGAQYSKGQYYDKYLKELKQIPFDVRVMQMLNMTKNDLIKIFKRIKFNLKHPVLINYRHGDAVKLFDFNTNQCLKEWCRVDDRWDKTGTSEAFIKYDALNKAICLHGSIRHKMTINTEGNIFYSGCVALKSFERRIIFTCHEAYDWSDFTHITFEVRGDGRKWMLNLHSPGILDVFAHNIYTYPIFTKGGPYWQKVRIPLSKFIFINKGIVMDDPNVMNRNLIYCMSFLLSEPLSGQFSLKVRNVYVVRDMTHKHQLEYEKYKVPKYIVTAST